MGRTGGRIELVNELFALFEYYLGKDVEED